MNRYEILLEKKPIKKALKEPKPIDIKSIIDFEFQIINNLIVHMSRINRVEFTGISEEQYKREHATIKSIFPRRMGNTTLALKCLREFENSILIVRNESMLISLWNIEPNLIRNKVYTFYNMHKYRFCEGTQKIVIVDTASTMREELMNSLYKIKADAFILLG